MTTVKSIEQEKNWGVAREINRETRANPASIYAGKFVVISGGEVVAVVDTLDEVTARIKALGLKLGESCFVEASADPESTLWISPFMEFN